MQKITGLGIDNPNALEKNYTSSNFKLAKTHRAHMSDSASVSVKNTNSFKDLLFQSLDEASSAINNHEQLRTKSIIDPDSVNPHDISLAGVKSRLSVQMVKSIVDRALEAYRTVIALR